MGNTFNGKTIVVLNIILILIAISSILVAVLKLDSIELKYTAFASALACFGAVFKRNLYRYILAGVALILLTISFFL